MPMNNNDLITKNGTVLPSLTLAYIGDAVYELWVRRYLISAGITRVNTLHRTAVKYVNAETQSKLVGCIEPYLDEEEHQVLKRGRNAKSGRQPKNVDMIDYRRATGLEALVGYWYLSDRQDKLEHIFSLLVDLLKGGNLQNK